MNKMSNDAGSVGSKTSTRSTKSAKPWSSKWHLLITFLLVVQIVVASILWKLIHNINHSAGSEQYEVAKPLLFFWGFLPILPTVVLAVQFNHSRRGDSFDVFNPNILVVLVMMMMVAAGLTSLCMGSPILRWKANDTLGDFTNWAFGFTVEEHSIKGWLVAQFSTFFSLALLAFLLATQRKRQIELEDAARKRASYSHNEL